MAAELLFSRETNIPWGFRLTGGADCEVPLTVIKVTEGSIAELVGMRVGDALVKINDVETTALTHVEAHDVILQAGDNFVATVIRGEPLQEPLSETDMPAQVEVTIVDKPRPSVETEIPEMLPSIAENPHETVTEEKEAPPASVKEQQPTKMRSQETEGIGEVDMMGVDIQKFMPMIELITETQEFKKLAKDIKEKQNLVADEEKRWTTFLQRPNRPKPKTTKKEDNRPKGQPYKVEIKIVKKPKEEIKPEKQEGYKVQLRHKKPPEPEPAVEIQSDMAPDEEDIAESAEEEPPQETQEPEPEAEPEEPEQVPEEVEMSVEEQLANVQKQLLTLSQLPMAIQQTLDAVTQQIAKIVGPPVDPDAPEENPENEEENYETIEEEDENLEQEQEALEGEEEEHHTEEVEEEHEEEPEVEAEPEPEPEPELSPEEREAIRAEQEKIDKKQKELEQLEEQHQRRLKQRPPSVPLTPLPRPIFLPGGRRWCAPGDAIPDGRTKTKLTDEVIAETISSQSEIIVGHTLGDCNCQMVPSKVNELHKINFLKYQPVVQSLEHLKNSEVYKLVHNMDAPEPRGIISREGKALAEEDYYQNVQQSQSKEMQCQ